MTKMANPPQASGARTVMACVMIVASLSVLVHGLVLLCLQIYFFDHESYSEFALLLVEQYHYATYLPGIIATCVIVVTVADVLRRKGGSVKDSLPLLAAVVLLNVGAAIWYWSSQLRNCVPKGTRE